MEFFPSTPLEPVVLILLRSADIVIEAQLRARARCDHQAGTRCSLHKAACRAWLARFRQRGLPTTNTQPASPLATSIPGSCLRPTMLAMWFTFRRMCEISR
jgi:hypothetical protein